MNKTVPSIATDLGLTPQGKKVLSHLRRHDHISNMQALTVFGISRLAATIYELRNAGYSIVSEAKKDDAGHKYTKYRLRLH